MVVVRHVPFVVLAMTLATSTALGQGAAAPSAGQPVLKAAPLVSEKTFWRKHYTFLPVVFVSDLERLATRPGAAESVNPHPSDFAAPPPAGWTGPDFDDSDWLLRRGREFVCGDSRSMEYLAPDATSPYLRGTDPFLPGVGLICQRARFRVSDRSAVRKLALSLTYRGGFVAWLNGKEIARANLPAGAVGPTTPAEAYPLDAFYLRGVEGKPQPLHWYTHSKSDQWPLRERTFGPVEVDRTALRDGQNVLAVEFHRSAYPDECRKAGLCFGAAGLSLLELTAEPPAAAQAEPVKRSGIQVWPADVARGVSDRVCPNYDEKLAPVRIVGARNGTFWGQVLVTGEQDIADLSAKASALQRQGGGAIPAEALTVRYGAPSPLWGRSGLGYLDTVLPADAVIDRTVFLGRRFDLLLEKPPGGQSAVPVWLSVRVPRDVPAGDYEGTLTVAAAGSQPTAVPVRLHVADWTLPDMKDCVSLINIYQSPDTLAEYYTTAVPTTDPAKPQKAPTPRWSDRHWQYIERSLALMGGIGNIGLFIPLLAESQMGNPESLVVWVRRPDGSYDYDLAVFDRYLDTALKYHDRLRFVSLNVWGYECRRDDALVTVQDKATGERSNMKLPAYGTPECEALWRPLLLALRDRLKARGLEKKILFGLASDAGPHHTHVRMFRNILPEATWIAEAHMQVHQYVYDPDTKAAVPVKYNSIVWGGSIPDPSEKRLYGWRHGEDRVVMNFNRAGTECLVLNGYPPPWSYRMWMESTLACGRNGNGRVGGDYWAMGIQLVGGRGSSEAVGGSSGTRFGMHLRSATGQTGLGNSTTDLFGPGPDGPVSTVRLENAREGNQQSEARIAIEQALLDKQRPLPDALAARCQKILDDRTRVLRLWPMGAAALAPYRWQERDRLLFEAAGEVRKALAGGPSPAPPAASRPGPAAG